MALAGVVVPGLLGAMTSDGTKKEGAPDLAESGDRAPGVRMLTS